MWSSIGDYGSLLVAPDGLIQPANLSRVLALFNPDYSPISRVLDGIDATGEGGPEADSDVMEVFDGSSADDPLLATFSGTTLTGTRVTSSSGKRVG